MSSDLDTLAAKADDAIAAARGQVLDMARAMLNEAGLSAARRSLAHAFDDLGDAQNMVRDASDSKRVAQQAHDDAFAAALSDAARDHVIRDGNKTYWFEGGDDRRQVTADEARDLAKQAATAATAPQRKALDHFDQQLAAARDRLDLAKTRISVARADLAAAVAHIQLFAGTLGEMGAIQ